MKKIIYEGVDFLDNQECLIIETYGDLKFLPRNAKFLRAIFGGFERTDRGTLLYTATIERKRDGSISHYPDDEYEDDYEALKGGRAEVLERVSQLKYFK